MQTQISEMREPLQKSDPKFETPWEPVPKEFWDIVAQRFGFENHAHLKASGCDVEIWWTSREAVLIENELIE